MLMGHKRWVKILRFVIVYIVLAILLAYISPKAC